jgi:murein DD-endopeptidase MepM/ murein hydrolase activator NlpD
MATFIMPFPEKCLTGHFGKIRTIRGKKTSPHRGTDWAVPIGTPLPAISSGTVKQIQFSKVLGWTLTHTVYGRDKKTLYVSYCHMDKKPTLKVGDRVKTGQIIGLSGNTGMSSGPHVHITLSPTLKGVFYGQVLDVYKYLLFNIEKPVAVKPQPKKIEKPIKITTIVYACPHCKKELK